MSIISSQFTNALMLKRHVKLKKSSVLHFVHRVNWYSAERISLYHFSRGAFGSLCVEYTEAAGVCYGFPSLPPASPLRGDTPIVSKTLNESPGIIRPNSQHSNVSAAPISVAAGRLISHNALSWWDIEKWPSAATCQYQAWMHPAAPRLLFNPGLFFKMIPLLLHFHCLSVSLTPQYSRPCVGLPPYSAAARLHLF